MTRPPLPAAFVERLRVRLGRDEADALAAALAEPPAVGLRAHPRVAPPLALASRLGWAAGPVPWCPEGAVLERPDDGRHPAGRHPWHEAGAYYLQDPSAMGVVPALDPQPGERVLDLAAAPGGKATHAEGRMRGEGLLWVHDAVPKRVDALLANLERWGARQTVVSQGPVTALQGFAGTFDRVLLDAPCSGEGMFRKSDAARSRWSPARVAACAASQATLLDLAADLVRPGGVLVYATCTFADEEDEAVVAALLARRPDLRPDPCPLPGVAAGRPPAGAPRALAAATARWWPHRQVGEGHFVARLRRDGDALPAATTSGVRMARGGRAGRGGPPRGGAGSDARPAPREDVATWRAFAQAVLGGDPFDGRDLWRFGDALHAVPEAVPAGGPPPRRVGVPLGRLAPGRFEPHHALSRVLPDHGDAAARLDLDLDDPRVARYLRGEALTGPAPDGWVLVRAGRLPLGWAKARAGEVNNRYPRGLRRDLAAATVPGPDDEADLG